MNASERREKIIQILQVSKEPISARKLAQQFSVSRQVIVGDVALLRAEGQEITATPRGYIYGVLEFDKANQYIGKVVCYHTEEQTEEELSIIVDHGGEILDVEVEHPFYGLLSGKLQIQSRHDLKEFLEAMRKNNSKMLSSLTGGVHLHTIRCADQEAFIRIKKALDQAGILYH